MSENLFRYLVPKCRVYANCESCLILWPSAAKSHKLVQYSHFRKKSSINLKLTLPPFLHSFSKALINIATTVWASSPCKGFWYCSTSCSIESAAFAAFCWRHSIFVAVGLKLAYQFILADHGGVNTMVCTLKEEKHPNYDISRTISKKINRSLFFFLLEPHLLACFHGTPS